MFVDAIHIEHQEFHDGSYPFTVPACEIVVDRHHMHTLTGEGIEISREGSHERLSFPGTHFRDLTVMENHTPDELYIIRDHVPFDLAAGSGPFIFPDRLIAFYGHIGLANSEIFIMLCGSGSDRFIFDKTTSGFFDDPKGFRKDFFQNHFEGFISFFQRFIQFFIEFFLNRKIGVLLGICAQCGNLMIYIFQVVGDAIFEFERFSP